MVPIAPKTTQVPIASWTQVDCPVYAAPHSSTPTLQMTRKRADFTARCPPKVPPLYGPPLNPQRAQNVRLAKWNTQSSEDAQSTRWVAVQNYERVSLDSLDPRDPRQVLRSEREIFGLQISRRQFQISRRRQEGLCEVLDPESQMLDPARRRPTVM
jgi:hypothetical protein